MSRNARKVEEAGKDRVRGSSIYRRRLASNIRGQVTRALRKRHITPHRYKAILGCTYAELAVHIEQRFSEGMTWENMGQWHVDHIIPVSYFLNRGIVDGSYNHFTNLQPLWAKDNLRKGAKQCKSHD